MDRTNSLIKRSIFLALIFVLAANPLAFARRIRGIDPLERIGVLVGKDSAQTILEIIEDYSTSAQEIRGNLENFFFFISTPAVPRGWWGRQTLSFQRIMVETLAKGLEKDSYLLVTSDVERRAVKFLNHKSLNGLLYYYNNLLKAGFESLPEKFQGILEEKDFALGKFYLLRKALDVLPHNLEEWLGRIKLENSQVGKWREVPLDIQREIVEMAAEELGKKIYLVLRDDLKKPFAFLAGKTLSGLIKSYSSFLVFRRELDIIPHTVSEWFDMIGRSRVIWAEVPREIQWELIKRAAQELGREDVLKVSSHDLTKAHFSFINDKTLIGLYTHYGSDIKALRELLILPRLIGEVPSEKIIFPEDEADWIAKFKTEGISVEEWEKAPMPVQRRFAQILADYLKKNPLELIKNDFWIPLPLFGPEGSPGRALFTLYNFYGGVDVLLEALGFR